MNSIHVDQAGYRSNSLKRAIILTEEPAFDVCRAADGTIIYSGMVSEPVKSPASAETVRVADFSDVTQPGEYYLCSGSGRSYPFIIDDKPYGSLRKAVLEMFDCHKCGVDLNCGVWSHSACHTSPATIHDTEEKKDVSGGWHDAGDYGRYIVAASKAVADLLLAYELSSEPDPEVLKIVWFEIEWMLKMQDDATGGVYHKVTCKNFCGLDVMPEDEKDELVISPISITATADFAATMAMAARFYSEKREILITAAQRAWVWCERNPDAPGFKNPPDISTGEYGDDNSHDERFWAACELFAATGEEKYHNYIKSGDLYIGLGWESMGTYGLAAYLFHAGEKADDIVLTQMKNKLIAACQDIMERYKTDPYGISLDMYYVWGSNMTVANNAMALLLGSHFIEGDKNEYIEAAYEHIHYLLGRNSLSQSYITGFGSTAPQNPHHRPSVAKSLAMPGMVVGGPDMNLSDDALQKACKGEAPAKCYLDDKDSYASNEVTIYWNSPVYFTLAVLGL